MFSNRATIAPILLFFTHLSQAKLRKFNFTAHSGLRAPDGVSREVYLINGQQPGPLIEVDEGDDIEVFVRNELPVDLTIHWHGLFQHGTPQMDGVPGVTQYPIFPNTNFTYRFSTIDQYGFYWYHSHFRTYYDDAIRGPLIIHPSSSRPRPFADLASNKTELERLVQAEHDAVPVMLNDWTHDLSDTVYAQYFETGVFPYCVDSLLANGKGRVECLPDSVLQAGTGLGMDSPSTMSMGTNMSTMVGSSMAMSTMGMSMRDSPTKSMARRGMSMTGSMTGSMGNNLDSKPTSAMAMGASSSTFPFTSTMTSESSAKASMPAVLSMSSMSGMSGMSSMSGSQKMTTLNAKGCTPPMMSNPSYNLSSTPPATCKNTTSQLLHIAANHAQGWLSLNLVNSGAVSKLAVSLDGHSMFVYAADGLYVGMQEVNVIYLEIGQRYSVLIKLSQPPDNYYLRFQSYPMGDMQQVIEGLAMVSYTPGSSSDTKMLTPTSWTLTNGSSTTNATTLSPSSLHPFSPLSPPQGQADVVKYFTINQTGITSWVMDGAPYQEAKAPVLEGPTSDGWGATTTMHLKGNNTVDLVMAIAGDSMDTMSHPIHLHGHKFFVLGSGPVGTLPSPYNTSASINTTQNAMSSNGNIALNMKDPAYRDTVELPMGGWLVIRYITNNPGAWLLHCHVQWHLVSGMALVLTEGL